MDLGNRLKDGDQHAHQHTEHQGGASQLNGDPDALPQLLYERRQMQEVVAVVCVPHDDIFPKGAVTAPNQGCAVSLLWHMHDPCPFLFGNLLGAVGTSVVRNYNFPIHAAFRQEFLGFADTYGQCLCLVKARH